MSNLLLEPPVATDPILLHAFARRSRPLSLGELLRAMAGTGLHLSEVPALLFQELAAGHVLARGFRLDAAGKPFGPRLYELTVSGWEVVEDDRLAV